MINVLENTALGLIVDFIFILPQNLFCGLYLGPIFGKFGHALTD